MDHLSTNSHLQITPNTMAPSMMDGNIDYIYGVWGPYTNSTYNILEFIENHNIVGCKSICDDGHDGRWIIIQSVNTAYIAQGPFTFNVDEMVMNDDNLVIGITLGVDNRFVEIRGLPGKPCFNSFGVGLFWVVSKLRDFNQVQGFCAPPTIPFSCDIEAMEVNIDSTVDSNIPEVKGNVSQSPLEEDVITEVGALCEGGTNEKIVELDSNHLISSVGDGTNLGATHGEEGLVPLAELQQHQVHLHDGESQSLGPLPHELDPSVDDVLAMFRGLLESGQASHYELEGQQTAEETVVSIPNLRDNNEPTRKRPWMDNPPCFSLAEVNNDIIEATPILEPIVGDGANGEAWTMSKKARVVEPPSPQSELGLNALKGSTGSNEVGSLEIASGNNNEDMASSVIGILLEPLEGNALHPLLDQGTFLSIESQRMSPLGTIEDIFEDREMEAQMEEGTVATMNSSSKGCKPRKKRPRQSKSKQHGVKRREGGRESFVAYFRPKDLPESNKTFLTIGEFSNERLAWNAFNLFAFIHEGQESCINMVDGDDSIEIDAAVWGELPRVDLVAHLRLKGRGNFGGNDLPPNSFIPRYRNIKFRKNVRGIDKGKIRWFCDIPPTKGVTDSNVGNGTEGTCTYETAEEAAKEVDRLLMLKEGPMAWTNYSILDYMTEVEKDQWDPTWIPLQDNPKKYLSTTKYKSFD